MARALWKRPLMNIKTIEWLTYNYRLIDHTVKQKHNLLLDNNVSNNILDGNSSSQKQISGKLQKSNFVGNSPSTKTKETVPTKLVFCLKRNEPIIEALSGYDARIYSGKNHTTVRVTQNKTFIPAGSFVYTRGVLKHKDKKKVVGKKK